MPDRCPNCHRFVSKDFCRSCGWVRVRTDFNDCHYLDSTDGSPGCVVFCTRDDELPPECDGCPHKPKVASAPHVRDCEARELALHWDVFTEIVEVTGYDPSNFDSRVAVSRRCESGLVQDSIRPRVRR